MASFGVTADEIDTWMRLGEEDRMHEYKERGGIAFMADALSSDVSYPSKGINEDPADIAARKQEFGENRFPTVELEPFWRLWFNAWNDEMMKILTVAAIIALVLGVAFPEDGNRKTGWIDGAAILAAIVIVCTVTAVNDYSQERQFQALNEKQKERLVNVIRNGIQKKISIYDIVVGDVVCVGTGEALPADGVFIRGDSVSCDESAMTGEPISIKKNEEKPFMLSGCPLKEGACEYLVTAVGLRSEYGKLLAKVTNVEAAREETPLQAKLGGLAANIGYLGVAVAVIVFIMLTIYWVIDQFRFGFEWVHLVEILNFFIVAVTIIVVAVPEGLPLAVTIALAYSMKQMMKDNNLVRRLRACETMGGCTTICSDKTGTLTQNQMSVVKGYFCEKLYEQMPIQFSRDMLELVTQGICCNVSKTSVISQDEKKGGKLVFNGNATDCAMLVFVETEGEDYEKLRIEMEKSKVKCFPFSSTRKRMSTVVKLPDGRYRLFCKGAAEVVLERCSHFVNAENEVVELDSTVRQNIEKTIDGFCHDALRNIVIAYRDFEFFDEEDEELDIEDEPPEMQLTFIGLVGIEDPLRPEVADAVATCQKAGIVVRMVTGDHKETAIAIARKCGILTSDGTVLEGQEFRKMSDEELDPLLSSLQVLARSKPEDKDRLVHLLRERKRQLVAVTGDGANDAPALRAAHVGLAMGITGTDIAKEASDIIITDDNFVSVVKAVLWGRSIFDNIRKFLQFQLTVNVAALAISMYGPLFRVGVPLKAIQLLWVNLIMDSMGALALATEKPTSDLLDRPPINVSHPNTRLISNRMWVTIAGQSTFQICVLIILIYSVPMLWPDVVWYSDDHFTIIFNTFVWCQIFNEINARKVNGEWNCLQGIHTNWMFLMIIAVTVIAQILIVEFGGVVFHTVHLTWDQWLFCIAISAASLLVGLFVRLVPVPSDFLYNEAFDDEEEGEAVELEVKEEEAV